MKTALEVQEFTKSLEKWVSEAQGDEKRSEAAEKIIEVFKSDSSVLNLSRLYIKSLPEEIGVLTSLKTLNVGGNQLKTLPNNIGNLTSLEVLQVSSNQLTTFPDRMGDLTSLQWFYYSSNKLNSLPDKIGRLTAQEWIHFDRGQLTPEEVSRLTINKLREQLNLTPEEISKLQTEELSKMSELLQEIPKLKEEVSRSSSSSNTTRNRVVAAEEELARISEKYKSKPEDVEERSHISSNGDLTDYYQRAEKSFNEAFIAAAMLSTNEFEHKSSTAVRTLEAASNILSSLPFASAMISGTAAATDQVLASKRLGQFNNISDLNPTSNPVDGAIFAEKLARRLTISNEVEIKNVAKGNERQDRLKGIRGFISQAQEKVVASTKKQIGKLDDATARGLLGEDLSSTQLLALDNSKSVLHHVMNQTSDQIKQTKSDIAAGKQEAVIDRVVENAIGKMPVRLAPSTGHKISQKDVIFQQEDTLLAKIAERRTVVDEQERKDASLKSDNTSQNKSDGFKHEAESFLNSLGTEEYTVLLHIIKEAVKEQRANNSKRDADRSTPFEEKKLSHAQVVSAMIELLKGNKVDDRCLNPSKLFDKGEKSSLNQKQDNSSTPSGKTSAKSAEKFSEQDRDLAELRAENKEMKAKDVAKEERISNLEKLMKQREEAENSKGGCCVIS